MDDDTPVTILNKIVATLELHNEILVSHKEALDNVYAQLKQLKTLSEKLTEIEKSGDLDSSDAEVLRDMVTRLTVITSTVNQERKVF